MWSGDAKIIISVERTVLPITESFTSLNTLDTLSGFVNLTAISTTTKEAGEHFFACTTFSVTDLVVARFLGQSCLSELRSGKGPDKRLESHVPQAISEMLTCARTLK
jgi:hypothetical protein